MPAAASAHSAKPLAAETDEGSRPSGSLVEHLAARATRLYTLPAVAVKVLELTSDPEQIDAHALKACIEQDPALTSKVLRVVNSSLFALRREVSDLSQALALLGIKPLKLLVLGFSLPEGLSAGVAAGTLGWYWHRTLTKAVAAREICETIWHRPGDESFIAALLQDLGMLLLIQEVGAPYIDFLEKARQRGYDVPALETASMGFDHTALTAALLRRWSLPEATIEAVVRRSEDAACESARASAGSVGSIVYLAEWVARLLADGRWEALEQLLSIGRRDHHLASEQLAVLVETLEEKVRGLADVLSLELPQATDYRELLVTAQARLADVAADAAAEIVRHEQRDLALTPGASLAEEMRSLGAAANRIAGGPAKSGPRHAAAPVAPGPVTPGPPAGTDGPAARHPPALSAEAHRGLLGQLASAVAACRLSRCPLSLLLVELARADELVLMHGMERFHQSRSALEGACRGVDHPQRVCIPYGEAGFAVVLLGCDRQRAVRLGNQLAERTGSDPLDGGAEKRSVAAIGLGAATVGMPPKNFPPKDLLVAANRCLYGSHASGGGIVKSIEIY